MGARKRQRVPHPVLAPWVQAEKGRMTRLVAASGVTWAAVDRVVWHGTVPRYRIAEALAREVGCTVEDVIAGAELAAASRGEAA